VLKANPSFSLFITNQLEILKKLATDYINMQTTPQNNMYKSVSQSMVNMV